MTVTAGQAFHTRKPMISSTSDALITAQPRRITAPVVSINL